MEAIIGGLIAAAGAIVAAWILKPEKKEAPLPEPEPLAPIALEPPTHLKDYCDWALKSYQGLRLLGVGAGDVQLPLQTVYVPLGMRSETREWHGKGDGVEDLELRSMAAEEGDDGRFGLDEIFSRPLPGGPHVAIFGEPGAGKTTALRKLVFQCLAEQEGLQRLGLDADTIPVFLRLRQIKSVEELGNDLEPLLRDGLAAESSGKLDPATASQLLGHGKLLLLLDGLDEMADDDLRRELCRFLNRRLDEAGPGVRAVISCRRSGYGGIELEHQFRQVVVQPLNDEEIQRLVKQWFSAVEREEKADKAPGLRKAQAHLLKVLADESPTSERLKLASSPLLLTLLCIVVYKGHEMPRHRVDFFAKCLEILLSKWSEVEREQPRVLEVGTALAVLRPLAYRMHRKGRQYDLREEEFVLIVGRRLKELGREEDAFDVFRWLWKETGVLTAFPEGFGFVHLAIQEYLAALHLASEGGELFDELCQGLEEQAPGAGRDGEAGAWREVLLLLVGIPGGQVFVPLMKRLLASDLLVRRTDLLGECLEEAVEVEIKPFLEVLAKEKDPDRQAAILRLVRGRRNERLVALCRELMTSPHDHVKARAEQIVLESERSEASRRWEFDLGLLHSAGAEGTAAAVEAELCRHDFRILRYAGEGGEKLQALVRHTQAAVVLWPVGGERTWEAEPQRGLLELLAESERPCLGLILQGEGRLRRPKTELVPEWLDARKAIPLAELEVAMGGSRSQVEVVSPASPVEVPRTGAKIFEEPTTGMRLLWVPEGRFEMGAGGFQEEAKPPHPVELRGFWLGETPVTNRQYGVYLEALKKAGSAVKEPSKWRARQYSSPDQPVVGVSWEDSRAFCQWLSRVAGRSVELPTEAQWEYAARSSDGRKYPWGDKPEPNSELACFGAKQPAAVGSYPAGKGPFGHLDLAGNVWEWCLDGWDPAAYEKHAPRNPVIPFAGVEERVMRGGGWLAPARSLRSAVRLRYPAGGRSGDLGFRVSSVSSST